MSKLFKFAIYAAHGEGKGGGYDPGAINSRLGLQEHKISVKLCEFARDELAGYDCEVSVFNLDASMSLTEIIAHANKGGFDIIIAPHLNAHTDVAYGTEAYYYPNDKLGKAIADSICKELSIALSIPQRSNGVDDGGDKASTYFGFVRQTKPTAILLETCFITTDSEAKKVDEAHEQKATGQAIARGIVKTLGLKQKAVPTRNKYSIIITGFCGITFTKQKSEEFVKVFWDGKKGNYCRELQCGNSHSVEMQAYLNKADADCRADALALLGWIATVRVM
ncbi:MAG: N-acetylmuramoyl-L-alanine amidase [Oscillospiraceae bacterium]